MSDAYFCTGSRNFHEKGIIVNIAENQNHSVGNYFNPNSNHKDGHSIQDDGHSIHNHDHRPAMGQL